jgi:hypothetical protein
MGAVDMLQLPIFSTCSSQPRRPRYCILNSEFAAATFMVFSRGGAKASELSDIAHPIGKVPGLTGQSSTHGRRLMERPDKPGDDREVRVNLNQQSPKWDSKGT